MKLSDLYPKFKLLHENNISKLKQYHISTLPDLLAKDPEQLVNILQISYTQVIKLLDDLLVASCTFPVTGLEVHHRNVQREIVFKTDCLSLDNILTFGGFKTGNIYQVFGSSGVGKSQLCFSLAVAGVLCRKEVEVFYIDTKNDLVAERILQILQAKCGNSAPNLNLLSQILVHKCFDIETLISTLRALIEKLKDNLNKIRLVILDNLVSPIMSILSEDVGTGFYFSDIVKQLLYHISSLGCCVITVNNARFSGNEVNPALGKVWSDLTDIRLKFEKVKDSNERNVTLSQNNDKHVKHCTFTINQAGISCTNALKNEDNEAAETSRSYLDTSRSIIDDSISNATCQSDITL